MTAAVAPVAVPVLLGLLLLAAGFVSYGRELRAERAVALALRVARFSGEIPEQRAVDLARDGHISTGIATDLPNVLSQPPSAPRIAIEWLDSTC